jgi:hypothetical protein
MAIQDEIPKSRLTLRYKTDPKTGRLILKSDGFGTWTVRTPMR